MKKAVIFTGLLATCLSAHSGVINGGDVLGRDLSVPGFRYLGHVGLATAKNTYTMDAGLVLEAMHDGRHIQQNTIQSFKNASKYWGAKSGLLAPHSDGVYWAARSVVDQYYRCPEYTITSSWRAGKIDRRGKVTQCAKFRCDTLVNYAYYKGGMKLPTYNTSTTLPYTIWTYLPVTTDAGVKSGSQEMKPVFKEIQQLNFKFNDAQVKEYWQRAKDSSADEKELIYDVMTSYYNKLKLDDVLERFDEEKSARNKVLILSGLQELVQGKKHTKADADKLYQFYKKLLAKNINKEINGYCVRGIEAVTDKDTSWLADYDKNLQAIDSINMKMHFAKKYRDMEEVFIISVINDMKMSDYPLDETATFAHLIKMFEQQGIDYLTPESKRHLLRYVDSVSYKAEPNSNDISPLKMPDINLYPVYHKLLRGYLSADSDADMSEYKKKMYAEYGTSEKNMMRAILGKTNI